MASDPPVIVIAAGGDGTRIGGNKPALHFGGQRLIDRMIAWARPQTDMLALAVRPNDGDWGTGLPLLYDRHQNIGPISALSSAMQAARSRQRENLLLIGCDLPFLPLDLIERLSAGRENQIAAMPISHGRIHPMAGLWRVIPDQLEQWIEAGGQSMWRFARDMGMAEVVWTETPDPFTNINDHATLVQAEVHLKS